MGVVAAVVTLSSIAYALSLPDKYKSEVLLAPVSHERQGLAANVASRFGAVADLAGLDVGGDMGVSETTVALEILKSKFFLNYFVSQHELSVPLIAGVGWKSDENEWSIDPDLYNVENNFWVRSREPIAPSEWEIYEKLKGILNVKQDKKTNLIFLSIELESPVAARDWVLWLVQDINDYLREQDVIEMRNSIEFLHGQLAKTSIAEMQNIFYQLIEEQTKKMMLAEVRKEYAFKVLDPPSVPERKSGPPRTLLCLVGAFAGIFLGAIYVVTSALFRRR